MVLTVLTGCKDYEEIEKIARTRGTGLFFCVYGDRQTTRQYNAVVQPSGEISECYLFPYDDESETLSKSIRQMNRYENTTRYYDEDLSVVPDGTSSFVCYAKSVDPYYYLSSTDSLFANGSTLSTVQGIDQEENIPTGDITFSPDTIYKEKEGTGEPKVDAKATAIAKYLTAIADSINALTTENKDELFQQFINEGNPIPCSSTNVQKLASWAKGEDITLPDSVVGYPANINLPDGAAVVMWQKKGDNYCFVPQPVTTTEANINSLNRFVYPASLWYYVNSRIKTSASFQNNFYTDMTWTEILKYFETDNGSMEEGSVNSVAIKDPLFFAVGCLQIGLAAPESLIDAKGTTITLAGNTFPLTAVFISGQHKQDYNFLPKDDSQEYIIYDRTIPGGMSLGASATSTSETTPTVSTLAFQTIDYRSVRIALEFSNNSGVDFEGVNGTVFDGTKFYIMGTINVREGESIEYLKRAFTKDFITKGTVTINSLEKVYNYLPDLLDPRLEIGVKLVPEWSQSTTTNVPL